MTKSTQETVKTWSVVLGVLALLCGVAFAAGNYPTRGEWDESQSEQSGKMDKVNADVANMKLEQVRLRSSMIGIEKSQDRSEETQKDINRKLDKALLQGAANGGRNRNR